MQEVGSDHVWNKGSVTLLVNQGNNIIPNVSLSLQLRRKNRRVELQFNRKEDWLSLFFMKDIQALINPLVCDCSILCSGEDFRGSFSKLKLYRFTNRSVTVIFPSKTWSWNQHSCPNVVLTQPQPQPLNFSLKSESNKR